MIDSGTVTVERALRYAIRNADTQPLHLVYILHGYGQLAQYFLKKVETILPGNICFVAPEGMHRFYLNGTSGRVGASWMTREARELDIAENTSSLDTLHRHMLEQLKPEKITVVGFSQGGATAARWIANGGIRPDCFISWASVFPPDLDFPSQAVFHPIATTFVVGNNDVFFNEAAVEQACKEYRDRGFSIMRFEGGHDLDANILEQLISAV